MTAADFDIFRAKLGLNVKNFGKNSHKMQKVRCFLRFNVINYLLWFVVSKGIFPMIYKFPVTIPQLSGNAKRMLYVYTPKGYERNYRKRYPVLYMFDGHNMFYDKDAVWA